MSVTIALFVAGVAFGLAGACMWAWGVHSGQFRDLEKTKDQLFWPEIAPEQPRPGVAARPVERPEETVG
jgi:cbb3-type cytochrome oxidase maturation protein